MQQKKIKIILTGILAAAAIAVFAGSAALIFRQIKKEQPEEAEAKLAEWGMSETEKSETEKSEGENEEQNMTGVSTEALDNPVFANAGSFMLTYNGQESTYELNLKTCEKEYEKDGIEIYSEYIYAGFAPLSFPDNQYVLLIHTPEEWRQIYPVKEFLIDEEQSALYLEFRDGKEPGSVQKISFADHTGNLWDSQSEILNDLEIEEMLCSAHHLQENQAQGTFADLTVDLTKISLEQDVKVITGEASAVYKETGKVYYVDWKINEETGDKTAEPCILKSYDARQDAEAFTECSREFDRIEEGDWSHVTYIEGLEYMWGMMEENWWRMDVNGDGMPELLSGVEYEENSESVKQVCLIFAYQDGKVDLVYYDLNDWNEFLFIAENGNLIYEWNVSGGPKTSYYELCRFDEKWNREFLDALVLYYFYDGEDVKDWEVEYYKEYFPDTYGIGGGGIYFLRARPKTEEELKNNGDGKFLAREYPTKEQWLEAYHEMTGVDFYNIYWEGDL